MCGFPWPSLIPAPWLPFSEYLCSAIHSLTASEFNTTVKTLEGHLPPSYSKFLTQFSPWAISGPQARLREQRSKMEEKENCIKPRGLKREKLEAPRGKREDERCHSNASFGDHLRWDRRTSSREVREGSMQRVDSRSADTVLTSPGNSNCPMIECVHLEHQILWRCLIALVSFQWPGNFQSKPSPN